MRFAKSRTGGGGNGCHDNFRPFFAEKLGYFIEWNHYIAKKCKNILFLSETLRIFASAFRVCENPNMLLVKSSLVFVLVGGCRLAAPKFFPPSTDLW
jgi:hypothetical protein